MSGFYIAVVVIQWTIVGLQIARARWCLRDDAYDGLVRYSDVMDHARTISTGLLIALACTAMALA